MPHRIERTPADPDLALVPIDDPVEDLHQRRLAGSVFADDRVHLALLNGETRVFVGDDAGVSLPDPAHLDAVRRISGAHRVVGTSILPATISSLIAMTFL